jgi:hypothetical protein
MLIFFQRMREGRWGVGYGVGCRSYGLANTSSTNEREKGKRGWQILTLIITQATQISKTSTTTTTTGTGTSPSPLISSMTHIQSQHPNRGEKEEGREGGGGGLTFAGGRGA